jgi:hypothetical protein
MKHILQPLRFSLFLLAFVIPLMGCQSDNEAGVATSGKGTADSKYARGDDAAYEAYGKDHQSKPQAKPGPKQK